MTDLTKFIEAVAEVYITIDAKLASEKPRCASCGKCCNFEKYDHRLFVTSPEMIYFKHALGKIPVLPMTKPTCPYNFDGNCAVYDHRFAGCRIFSCQDSPELQSNLSETAIAKFKDICKQFKIEYTYTELSAALNDLAQK